MSDDPILQPRVIRVPEPASGHWLNDERPWTRERTRGHVVLYDFWDYTCVNCLRTLPYLAAWHRRYASLGVVILGIHTPEFNFAQLRAHVERAIVDYAIPYPILLDNDHRTWDRFAARAWPTKVLVDGDGYERLRRTGEGYYGEIERAIQTLLRQANPGVSLPEPLAPLRPEDRPGAVCLRPTPEVYAGVSGGGLFGGGLGNAEGYATRGPAYYELPPANQRQEGCFYLDGIWRAWPEAVAYAGETRGRIILPYRAATVNAVLSPSADPVETILDLRPVDTSPPVAEVRQDGLPLPDHVAGTDVTFDEAGRSLIVLDRPRMVQLARNSGFEAHELELSFAEPGPALYSFTFSGCVIPPNAASQTNRPDLTYTVR
jgi:thiol-disulfide isomerase/thioredoxin